jgi:hypothetical protein
MSLFIVAALSVRLLLIALAVPSRGAALNVTNAVTPVDMMSAKRFAVLAGTTLTNQVPPVRLCVRCGGRK